MIYAATLPYRIEMYSPNFHYSKRTGLNSLASLLRLASVSHELRSEIGGVLCKVFTKHPVHFRTDERELGERIPWVSLADRIPSNVSSVIRHVFIDDRIEIRRTPSTATPSASWEMEFCCVNLFECRQQCINCKKFPSMRQFQVLKEQIGDWQIRWIPWRNTISERCVRAIKDALSPDKGINDSKGEISVPGLGKELIVALLRACDQESGGI